MKQFNLPNNWSIKKLGDIGKFYSGFAFPDKEQGGLVGMPFFKVSDMNSASNASIMQVANNYVSDEQIIRLKYKPIKEKAIIFAKVGAAIFLERKRIAENFLIDNNMMAFVPNESIVYTKLLFDAIRLSKYVQVGALPSYNASDLKIIKILLPPLPEQEKIAEILSCWDDAIEQMQNLINEKKELKRGLMQQLLTSRVRIHGFIQQWKQASLQEIASVSKGTQLNRIDMIDSGFPVFNGGTTESGFTNKWNTEKNTIIISEGGNSCGFINYITKNFWAGGHCYTVVPKDLTDKNFLYQLLKYKEPNIMKLRVGSGLPNIQQGALNKFKLFLPSDVKEQHAIADILISADSEIALLNKKLDVLKDQKGGLMQKLLTGEIRVKVDKKS